MLVFRLTNGDDVVTYFLCGEIGRVMVRSQITGHSTVTPMNREELWKHWHAYLDKEYTPAKICKSA